MVTDSSQKILQIILIIFAVELLSFLAFLKPTLTVPLFILICLAVLVISLKDLRYGALLALAELFIGGFGYLFAWPAGGLNLSLRFGIFLILLAAAIFKIFKERKIEFFKSKFFFAYFFLMIFLLVGFLSGYFRGREPFNLFFDFNAFFFLAYLAVFYQAFRKKEDFNLLPPVFMAALIWLALKTLLVFFIFTHGFDNFAPLLYRWIRDTRVGEITALPNGFYRIFFQSQIYLVFGFILWTAKQTFGFPKKTRVGEYALGALLAAGIFLSLSRSFWLGLFITLPLLWFLALFFFRVPFGQILKTASKTIAVSLTGLGLIWLLTLAPFPRPAVFSLLDVFSQRTATADAAAVSRFVQLPPLWQAIKKHWLFGSGFGTTAIFKTSDPRILSVSPTGEHTAYAFEWGWLDIWLKIGFIGLLVYWGLLWKIMKLGWQNTKYPILNTKYFNHSWLSFGLIMSIFALLVIHIFTPYLNHPLGLGWVILVGLVVEKAKMPLMSSLHFVQGKL